MLVRNSQSPVAAVRQTARAARAPARPVSKDLKTVYVADSIKTRVLKIERD
jgi:hypothetical protein